MPSPPPASAEHEALQQELAHHPAARRAEGGEHRQLAAAAGRLGEQQAGDVDAGDHEHQDGRAEEDEEHGPDAAGRAAR